VSSSRNLLVISAALIGIGLCVAKRLQLDSAALWCGLAAGLLVAAAPPLGRAVGRLFDRVRHPDPKVRRIIALLLLLGSAKYALVSADLAKRPMIPQIHDESMVLLQARMLSHGRLWMPAHPMADFFDSFFIQVRPVYGAVYFPGTALFYVPGMWMEVAASMTSVLIAGLAVMFMYLLVTDLLDGVFGIIGALLLMTLPQWRNLSVAALSHPALLMLSLGAAWYLLQWSRHARWRWIIAAGAFAGWAAITRPVDAAILIAPFAIAAVMTLAVGKKWSRRHVLQMAAACLAATPFLALQLIQNHGMSGRWLRTPVAAYDAANFPGMEFGRKATALPATAPTLLPQAQDYYQTFLRPEFLKDAQAGFVHQWLFDRLWRTVEAALPTPLYFLLPIGLLALKGPWRMAACAGVLTIPLAYAWVPIFLAHYGFVAAPAFIFLALLGFQELVVGTSWRASLSTAGCAALIVFAIVSIPEVRGKHHQYYRPIFLYDVELKLASIEHRPAVVLFRYRAGENTHEEPVYNIDGAWPDDCTIIRAQDRGADDRRIFAYYATVQPERFFYRYDRGNTRLTPLGWAKDLAAQSATQP
jgi:hypothetical protein